MIFLLFFHVYLMLIGDDAIIIGLVLNKKSIIFSIFMLISRSSIPMLVKMYE
jgi:hypothetical protein